MLVAIRSHYSLGLGVASPGDLVERARALGIGALVLADLESLSGQVEFHAACRHTGVRGITGLELRPGFHPRRAFGDRTGRIILLARDREGWSNLCRIVSARRCGRRPAGGPVAVVAGHGDGLLALADHADILQALRRADMPAQDLGLMIAPASDAARMNERVATAARLGVPLVAWPEASLLSEADRGPQRLLAAIHLGRTLAGSAQPVSQEPEYEAEPHAVLQSADLIRQCFAGCVESLAAAATLAGRCTLDLLAGPWPYPSAPPAGGPAPPAPDPDKRLRSAAHAALARTRSASRSAAHRARLEQELDAVRRRGLSGTFLVLAEIVEVARRLGVPMIARGSAVGSLLVHLLGASPLDPLRYDLLFERFLHEAMDSPPDIDLDLPSDRRDEIVAEVLATLGADRAVLAGAHQRLQDRAALHDGLRALGADPREIAAAVRSQQVPADLREWVPALRRLVGAPRLLAAHPGGVVVADRPLADLVPLERTARGAVVCQFDAAAIERLGLVKFDLLGSRFLAELVRALGLAGYPRSDAVSLLAAAPDDPRVFDLIDRAETVGCFQLESPAMRALLARIPIRSEADIVRALGLIRPGAAAGQAKAAFVRRAHGEEPIEFPCPDPRVRALLAPSLGLLLFEEDMMALLMTAGGLTATEADTLRAAIVRSGADPGELRRLEERFVETALERSQPRGMAPDPAAPEPAARPDSVAAAARAVWAAAARFAAYSFSRAHAVSHARQACVAAWLAVRHPAAFGCALIDLHQGPYPLRTEAAALVRRGVVLLGPDVNASAWSCALEPGVTVRTAAAWPQPAVRIGLSKVGRLTAKAAGRILEARTAGGPFRDAGDLLARVAPPLAQLEALVLCGACDGLVPLSFESYPFAHEALVAALARGAPASEAVAAAEAAAAAAAQASAAAAAEAAAAARAAACAPAFGASAVPSSTPSGEAPAAAPGAGTETPAARYRSLVRILNELRFLRLHVHAHPLAILRSEADSLGCRRIAELSESVTGRVRVVAVLAAARRVRTATGTLRYLTLEDETGLVEAVLLPPADARLGASMTTPGPYLFEGRLRADHGAIRLRVRNLVPFHLRRRPWGERP